ETARVRFNTNSYSYLQDSTEPEMNQQGQNGTSEIKDLGVTPTLQHLSDFSEKCTTIKKLSTEILQKAEKDAAKKG
ncbi:19831_t:CDS:2, partial [Racocetra fulgida]